MSTDETQLTPQQTLDSLASLSYRSGELQGFLDEACQAVIDLLGEGLAAITLYQNNKKNVLALRPESEKSETQFETHGHLSTYVVDNKCVLTVEDAGATKQYGDAPEGYRSYLGLPLRMQDGSVVGTLCYFDKNVRHYSCGEQRTAELFAERIAIALDNYQLYQKLKVHSESLEQLVESRTSELLAARDELAKKEKLAAVGQFASQITHEIRNPLATIRLALEYIQKQSDLSAGSQKRAELACRESSRLEQLLTEVLLYAKPVQINPKALELKAFSENFVSTYESLVDSKHCRFQLNPLSATVNAVTVLADEDKLTQVCVNLITNACDASSEEGTIIWEVGVEKGCGFIKVSNTGETIPPAKLHKITDAFVSGKPGGFGLGLAIVKSIVDEHRGRLEIQSSDDAGTSVTVFLPLNS